MLVWKENCINSHCVAHVEKPPRPRRTLARRTTVAWCRGCQRRSLGCSRWLVGWRSALHAAPACKHARKEWPRAASHLQFHWRHDSGKKRASENTLLVSTRDGAAMVGTCTGPQETGSPYVFEQRLAQGPLAFPSCMTAHRSAHTWQQYSQQVNSRWPRGWGRRVDAEQWSERTRSLEPPW